MDVIQVATCPAILKKQDNIGYSSFFFEAVTNQGGKAP